MNRRTRQAIALAALLALGLAGYAAWRMWDFTCDDAFITFRYSRNLVRGVGPTFNVEPPRAEGCTSFLWMLLAAVPQAVASDPVAAAKAIGVVFSLLTAAVCGAMAWTLCAEAERVSRALAAALAAVLFAAYPFTAVHAVSGMDTSLAALTLSLLVFVAVRELRAPSRLVPCCALLAGLTRPELNLAAATIVLAKLLLIEKGRRRAFLLALLLFYVLPGAAYFAWRWAYYQSFLPLPFYVKAASLEARSLGPALSFAFEAAAAFGLLLAVAAVDLDRKSVPLLAVILVLGLYYLLPEPVMAYGHRYFHPLVPLLAVLASRGAVLLFSVVRERFGEGRAAFAYGGIVVLALGGFGGRDKHVWEDIEQYASGLRNAHVRLGRLLARRAGEPGAVLAIADAGAVPYYSGWETVDTFGLNDPHIARTGDHSAAYVFSRRPSLVVLLSWRSDVFQARLPWEQGLFTECVRRGMTLVGVLEFASGYYLWLMAAPDGPAANALQAGRAGPG